jgi:hypothetical protein
MPGIAPDRRPRAAGRAILWMSTCALCAAVAGPARALPSMLPPELVVGAGWTMGVNGEPGTGGAAATVAAQWPFAARWSFGGAFFAQDMGTEISTLQDPNTGQPLGAVATTHRMSYGIEWRAETTIRESKPLRWQWNGGFGYARQERDERGVVNDAVSGITASTGITGLWQTKHAHAFGVTLEYRHQFVDTEASPDRATRSVSAQLEWRWKSTPTQ